MIVQFPFTFQILMMESAPPDTRTSSEFLIACFYIEQKRMRLTFCSISEKVHETAKQNVSIIFSYQSYVSIFIGIFLSHCANVPAICQGLQLQMLRILPYFFLFYVLKYERYYHRQIQDCRKSNTKFIHTY